MLFVLRRDADGRYAVPFASDAVREFFGLERADVQDDAAPFFAVLHPDDRSAVQGTFEESARNLTRLETVFRVCLPGRAERWLMASAQPEIRPDGGVEWHGFNADITDQRRVEHARLAEAQRYKTLLSIATDAIHILDEEDGSSRPTRPSCGCSDTPRRRPARSASTIGTCSSTGPGCCPGSGGNPTGAGFSSRACGARTGRSATSS